MTTAGHQTGVRWPLTGAPGRFLRPLQCMARAAWDWLESWLEGQRDRLPLWLPVALGAGIAAWFLLPGQQAWGAVAALALGVAAFGLVLPRGSRLRAALCVGGLAMVAGMLLAGTRAASVAAPVLAYPVVTSFAARVEATEPLVEADGQRLLLAPLARTDMPPRVRVTVPDSGTSSATRYHAGDRIVVRARLLPPPRAAVPGAYDFARRAWFDGIGAVGRALEPPRRVAQAPPPKLTAMREALNAQIAERLPARSSGIATALVTGEVGGITRADADAMRAAGLSHLLSISGMHVSAVVAFTMLAVARLLALSPAFALRWPVWPIAAAAGAVAAVAYTAISGGAVPTVRSAIAALLVLTAMMLGREAMTLRLVATGALLVLVWRPEALVGPSFQMSFAAVAAIVALHETRWGQRWFSARDEHAAMRVARWIAGLVVTGLVVEAALIPISMFHFHRSGLYGVLANVVAIPLTTFVIMPAEALALALDAVGLGAPAWFVVDQAIATLLGLAHSVAAWPGAVRRIATPGWGGFALTGVGLLWTLLWIGRTRLLGIGLTALGMLIMAASPAPDMIVTDDGRHIVARRSDGTYMSVSARMGDFASDVMAEAIGFADPLTPADATSGVTCSRDFCVWQMTAGGAGAGSERPSGQNGVPRPYTVLAARSAYPVDAETLRSACAASDIVISRRFLPVACAPRLLKLDRAKLDETGGVTLRFTPVGLLVTPSRSAASRHPWMHPELVSGNDEAVPKGR